MNRTKTIALVSLAASALAVSALPPARATRAAVPEVGPVFSDPLRIDHPLLPFVEGAVKVLVGRSGGAAVTVVERHVATTRTFRWDEQDVVCHVIEELVFEGGLVTGTEQSFVAQADDGSLWTFGEIEDADPSDDGGNDAGDAGGWIVGAAQATDPPDLVSTAGPSLLLPAAPAVGDTWIGEYAPPVYETHQVVRSTDALARTPAGRLRQALRLEETDVPDGTRETRWLAPGLGMVKSRERGQWLSLRATTLPAAGLRSRRR